MRRSHCWPSWSFLSVVSHVRAQPLRLCLLWYEAKWQRETLLYSLLQKTRSNRSFSQLPDYSKHWREGGGGILASSAFLRQADGRDVFPWRQVEMPDIAVLELSAISASLRLFMVTDIHSICFIWVRNVVSH
jgi:hypothetical protein